ncbi:MAG: DNA-binding protein WhiA [Bacillota bacterium]|nr:DNA-binding protein WhiA [Bacillota bacterium]
MSFSSAAKHEIIHNKIGGQCCLAAELCAFLHLNGSIILGSGLSLMLRTEDPATARRVFTLLKALFGIHTGIAMKDSTKFKKGHIFELGVSGEETVKEILHRTGLMKGDAELFPGIAGGVVKKRCCRRAFLRGAFLAAGSVANPEKNYHLEFVTHSSVFAEDICRLLAGFGLHSKTVIRKGSPIVYLKDGEGIVEFLKLIGANNAILELENVRILKQVRNNVNRAVNCETANLQKTLDASYRQAGNIKYLEANYGFDKLSPQLRRIAELRLEYPDATLSELSELAEENIGKSGVNHRLRKLDEIAERIREKKGES